MKKSTPLAALAVLLSAAACHPYMKPLARTMDNGEVLQPQADDVVARARVEGELQRERMAEQRATTTAAALASCAPDICAAISRGEVALGMSEPQVLAATRTTAQAWQTRSSGRATVMTSLPGEEPPSDAVSPIAFVSFQNGRVASYTYREPQGMRTVSRPADATLAGVAAARADALLRQGDEYVAAGRLDLALAQYDEADILRPNDPETTLRIARTLDKSLRPIEAVMRYQLFIHQMELEKIEARGDAAAKIAGAIAAAHERIITIEKR
ncbi:MAG TPA: hypothetical protein VFI96_05010 [Longimicrobiaceae bacterium]|nr:hypothetical protein [Longimicrobiaceae bacterium]